MWRLIFFIATYLIFLVFRTIGILLGWLIIPPMAVLNKYTTKTEISKINGRSILNWKHKFMYLFGNDEDGLIGASEFKDKPVWFRIVYWCALRNPFNNIRFVKYLSCQIVPSKVKFVATHPKTHSGVRVHDFQMERLVVYDRDEFTFVCLTYCGLYSNIRIQFNLLGKIWRFWIGWKIYPHDSFGLAPSDYRKYGAGFATQFKRIYPRENK